MVHRLNFCFGVEKGIERCFGNTVAITGIVIMDGDWAHLPEDLLIHIAKRLECVEHLFAFSSICSSWSTAGKEAKSNWTPKIPLLMLSENTEDHPSSKWTVFDPSTNKRYSMDLPETRGRRCWGCIDGWICTLGLDMEFQLFNPFTRARVLLPTALKLPLLERYLDLNKLRDREVLISSFIRSVDLFKVKPDELLVCVRYNSHTLAFAKPGDSQWCAVENADEGPDSLLYVEDVISFRDKVLILYENGQLESLGDLTQFPGGETVFTPEEYVPGDMDGIVSLHSEYPPDNMYLAESSGDLLVVLQYTKDSPLFEGVEEAPRTWRFEVMRFDSEAKDWVQVDNVGDLSFFVGKVSTMAVSASDTGYCNPRSVYYIEDVYEPNEFSGHHLVHYRLNDYHQAEELPIGDDTLLRVHSPFWFMPKFPLKER